MTLFYIQLNYTNVTLGESCKRIKYRHKLYKYTYKVWFGIGSKVRDEKYIKRELHTYRQTNRLTNPSIESASAD